MGFETITMDKETCKVIIIIIIRDSESIMNIAVEVFPNTIGFLKKRFKSQQLGFWYTNLAWFLYFFFKFLPVSVMGSQA